MIVATLVLALLATPFSFRMGKLFRADLRGSVNADINANDDFDFGRARIGVEGKFLKHFQYEVEHDFRSTHSWKDVFLDLNHLDDAQVKVGKFKIPFSMDELTSVKALDFVNRSRIARDLAPARDIGVMLHGRLFSEVLGYQAGVFRNDGENSESDTGVRGMQTYAARLTAEPLKTLHFGAAVMTSKVPEGLNSLKQKGAPEVYVKGKRLRFGTEFRWESGPFSIKSEWVHVSEARNGQSIRQTDLPAKLSRGMYLSGTWRMKKPFQLAARYERVWYGSADPEGIAFSSPRSPTLPVTVNQIWTGGVNWFPHPFVKIQFNGVRDQHWTGVIRLQFSM
jgi:phosphate-selective porin